MREARLLHHAFEMWKRAGAPDLCVGNESVQILPDPLCDSAVECMPGFLESSERFPVDPLKLRVL
jgi:hypothetical protein